MRSVFRICSLLCLLTVPGALLQSQTFRGALMGTVTDATGAVVPGAKVTVKNMDTGVERTTESNADGAFRVPELPVGRYSMAVLKEGFDAFLTENLNVAVASQLNVDVTLKA